MVPGSDIGERTNARAQRLDLCVRRLRSQLAAGDAGAAAAVRPVQIPLLEFDAPQERTAEEKTSGENPGMQTTADWIALPLEEAMMGWLETRVDHVSEKTHHEYKLNIKTLTRFYTKEADRHHQARKLSQFQSPAQLEAYQKWRIKQCGAPAINHELGVLQQILRRIGVWEDKFEKYYQPLPLPNRRRGRSIEEAEREQLWGIMHSNHDWDALRLFLTIMINSTASPSETMRLKLGDVILKNRYFEVGNSGAKNRDRVRNIPFNDESETAFREAIGRAKILGAHEPWHYLFPKRISGNHYDPMKHQTTFRTAWDKVKAVAIKQGMAIARLRMEDMRHSAGSRLWANPQVAASTAQNLMGHGSEQMKKYYDHVRADDERKAIESLAAPWAKKPQLVEMPKAVNGTGAGGTGPSQATNRALAEQLLLLASKLLNQE
jgi:integrase